MTINMQIIQEGRDIRQEIMLEIGQAKKGVFTQSNLSNSDAIRSSAVNPVANVGTYDPTVDASVQAIGILSQLYMLSQLPFQANINKIIELEMKLVQLEPSVDPTIQNIIATTRSDLEGGSFSQQAVQNFAGYMTTADEKTNPILLASKYISSIPDFSDYDSHFGYALAMFYLSVYGASTAIFVKAQHTMEKMLAAHGNEFSCETDMWQFLLCYAKENGISTDSLLAMLPPAPANCPEYTQLIADIKANAATFPPNPQDPKAEDIWLGADLAAFMKLFS